jgi:hypothetical protein
MHMWESGASPSFVPAAAAAEFITTSWNISFNSSRLLLPSPPPFRVCVYLFWHFWEIELKDIATAAAALVTELKCQKCQNAQLSLLHSLCVSSLDGQPRRGIVKWLAWNLLLALSSINLLNLLQRGVFAGAAAAAAAVMIYRLKIELQNGADYCCCWLTVALWLVFSFQWKFL